MRESILMMFGAILGLNLAFLVLILISFLVGLKKEKEEKILKQLESNHAQFMKLHNELKIKDEA